MSRLCVDATVPITFRCPSGLRADLIRVTAAIGCDLSTLIIRIVRDGLPPIAGDAKKAIAALDALEAERARLAQKEAA